MERDQLLAFTVYFLNDPKIGRTAPGVIGGMRLALMFRKRQKRRVPGVCPQPVRVVDRKSQIIADLGTRSAFRLVFVKLGRPFSGGIELRERRHGEKPRQYAKRESAVQSRHIIFNEDGAASLCRQGTTR